MTKNEIRLIKHFGLLPTYRRMQECGSHPNPVDMMLKAIIEAFMRGELDTPEARALRRGYKAIQECSPTRSEPEYEKLLELEPVPKCYDEVIEHEREISSLTPPSK
jgi:hypothetical protein